MRDSLRFTGAVRQPPLTIGRSAAKGVTKDFFGWGLLPLSCGLRTNGTAEIPGTPRQAPDKPEEPEMTEVMTEEEQTLAPAENDTHEDDSATPRFAHNIMDVLAPANPPEPVNARVIRRFDLEAAQDDARRAAGSVAKPTRQAPRRRSQLREERNQSLLKAAGLA